MKMATHKIIVYPTGEEGQYGWTVPIAREDPSEDSKLIPLVEEDWKRFKEMVRDKKHPETLNMTLASLYTQDIQNEKI